MGKIKCIVCEQLYNGCDKKDAAYKTITCSDNHFQIHLIVKDYANGNIDKEAALEKLNKCDLTGYESFKTSTVKVINEIKKEEVKKTVKKTKVSKAVLDIEESNIKIETENKE